MTSRSGLQQEKQNPGARDARFLNLQVTALAEKFRDYCNEPKIRMY
ncbi:MAG: hypothetical protein LUQ31_01945 [Methanoregula sp.]|nr:hypothetical protein [Methanoregula sp.]